MTATPTPTSPVEVIQADREAAADLVVPHGRWPGFPADFRSGRADQNELTQAFARHRLASPVVGEGVSPIERLADSYKGGDPVNDTAIILMRAWGRADPRSDVALHPASFVATFADMARAVIASPTTDPERSSEVERLREAAEDAAHSIDAALNTTDDVIEWAEPIKASRRGREDEDELRKERKDALYGMLESSRARLLAALHAPADDGGRA